MERIGERDITRSYCEETNIAEFHITNDFASQPFDKFFLDEKTADVHFVFVSGDNQIRIPAHKIILSSKCAVFEAMFYGELKEADDVIIVDVSIDAFKSFLRFFYCNEVMVSIANIGELMYLADKYLIEECMDTCKFFLERLLPREHICLGLELSMKFSAVQSQEILEQQIAEEPYLVFESSSFIQCPRNVLKRILELDDLKCYPVVVFEACIAWAENAAAHYESDASKMENNKQQLGECFYLIPFYLMYAEIAKIVEISPDLFDREEMADLVRIMEDDGKGLPELKKFQRKKCFATAEPSKCIDWDVDSEFERKTNEFFMYGFKYFDATVKCHAVRLNLNQKSNLPSKMQPTIIKISDDDMENTFKQFVFLYYFEKNCTSLLIKLSKPITFQQNTQYTFSSLGKFWVYIKPNLGEFFTLKFMMKCFCRKYFVSQIILDYLYFL